MKILVADKFEQAGLDALARLNCDVNYDPAAGAERFADAVASVDPDVLIVRSSKATAGVIEKGKSLKLIIRAGAGVDNIDVGAASARGIRVCNTPGMNAIAVAELTIGLLLCCDRRLPDQTVQARAGTWNKKEFAKGRGLKGLTLGVVGVGAIGQEVIRRATPFGMRVIVWSRSITQQHAAALNCEWGGTDTPALMDLARTCDAVSVHLPLADTTKKLLGKQFFDAMKPGAYFINTSRGGVVDEAALRDAVTTKGIRAGLDVFEDQPSATQAPWDNQTVKLPGVYATHHCGASTDQAQAAVADEAVRVVRVFMETGRAENCVNG